MAESVTAEDLARDLTADLALLAACKPDADWCEGPGLHVMEWADGHGVFSSDNDLLAAVGNNLAMGLRSEPYARMFAASYVGWQAAIRLALHWRGELEKERAAHKVTFDYFVDEVKRKTAALGNSLEGLVECRNQLLDLGEEVARLRGRVAELEGKP